MPFMDGLELAKVMKERYPHIKIIILTGFDEFKYAQKAIELNVIEYILKPVSSENLKQVLDKVKIKLDLEIENKEDILALKKHYIESIPVMKENFLNSLLMRRQEKEEMLKKADSLNVNLRGNNFIVCVVAIDTMSLKGTNFVDEDFELVRFAILNTAEEILKKYNQEIVFSHNNYIAIIQNFETDNRDSILDKTFKSLDELRQSIEKYMKITLTVGIGNIVNNVESLKESYLNAISALDYKFVVGKNRLIYIEDLEPESFKKIYLDENIVQSLLTVIKVGTIEEAKKIIEKIFNEIIVMKVSISDYQLYFLELLASLIKVVKGLDLDMDKIFGQNSNILNEIFGLNSIEEVKVWFENICSKLISSIYSKRQNSCKLNIENAKEYINKNYQDSELSINNVSSFLHISPSYFGALFKQETGDTYINFLLKVRMEKAKGLICSTDLKNFQIAEKIGYADQHYFSYSFKKYFKVSPNEFRNSLSKE